MHNLGTNAPSHRNRPYEEGAGDTDCLIFPHPNTGRTVVGGVWTLFVAFSSPSCGFFPMKNLALSSFHSSMEGMDARGRRGEFKHAVQRNNPAASDNFPVFTTQFPYDLRAITGKNPALH